MERYTITQHKTIGFEGYFRPNELLKELKDFLKERKYFPFVAKNYEEVLESGLQIRMEIKAMRKVSHYVKKEIFIRVKMLRLKEELIEIDGTKRKYFHGKVELDCDSVLQTDMKGQYDKSGWLYLLRIINDKFVRRDWIDSAKDEVDEDLHETLEHVSSYLNMIRFKQ